MSAFVRWGVGEKDFLPQFEVLGRENGVEKELIQTQLAAAKGGVTGIVIFVGDMDDDELKDDTCMGYWTESYQGYHFSPLSTSRTEQTERKLPA
jgi:hypothetical protein